MILTSSLVSIRDGRNHLHSLPPIVVAFSLVPGLKHALSCGGIFLSALFISPRHCQPKKSLSRVHGKDHTTASDPLDQKYIQGCRDKNRPNGTSNIADHGLVFGGAVRLAPGKQMLPGKSWMTPVMVLPLQPVGAFAHKASL